MFLLEKGVSPNVVTVRMDAKKRSEYWFLLRGDVHWDNPKSCRDIEEKHLKEALDCDAGIIDVGDLFCCMQSKWDPRSCKKDVRPEHQSGDYLDALVRTAADFYQPYAKNFVALGMGNHECHDDKTEVLTDEGWKLFADLSGAESVGTRSPETGEFEWQRPLAYIDKPFDGELIVAEGKTYSFAVTPGHNMMYKSKRGLSWKMAPAEQYFDMAHRAVQLPVTCENHRPDLPNVSDDMIRLVGLILTDGSLTSRPGKTQQVLLFQGEKKAHHVRELLDRLGVTYSESVEPPKPVVGGIQSKQNMYRWYVKDPWRTSLVELMNYQRRIPGWAYYLSKRQVSVLLDTIIFADGSDWDKGFTRNKIFKTKGLLEDLQVLLIQNGIRSSLRLDAEGTKKQCWALNVCHNKSFTTVQEPMVKTPYSGRVYCCQTPNGTLITRRDGKVLVSGNCTVLNRHETNLTERLAQSLRDRTGAAVPVTGYTGWVRFVMDYHSNRTSRTLWHCHGYGGGGPVTKDTIQAQRQHAYIDGADIMVSGHVHERWLMEHVKVGVDQRGEVKHRPIWYVKTGTYKEEYGSGTGGWHVGTGKPPKPIGGWWLKLTFDNKQVKGDRNVGMLIEITPTT
jgi:hypothetical protein